jgi:cytidylate kinase
MLAQRLGWLYLDTGAMYRAMTVKMLRKHVPLHDPEAISRISEKTKVELIPSADGTRVLLDGMDVTADIRTPEVDLAIGPVCETPKVREILVRLQRELAEGKSVVAEGRDMGTVVFPKAAFKFFLTASVEERALRRKRDLDKQGITVSLVELKKDIERRDSRDRSRKDSPLARAEDSELVDTSNLTVDEQVDLIMNRMGIR